MHAIITNRRTITGLNSGSAIERIGDFYFVVSDDSPWLYRLDDAGNIVGTTRLFDSSAQIGERIPKKEKPDLEGMTAVEWDGRAELLLFGSGSKSPTRDVCFRVDVTVPAEPKLIGRADLNVLYNTLRAHSSIVGSGKLNLEAAASNGETLLLFQRGNISGVNAVAALDLPLFMRYLDYPASFFPAPFVSSYPLPQLQNRIAGFSGADILPDQSAILFSASVEDTLDEIQDGPTLGSFIGLLDADILSDEPTSQTLHWVALVEEQDGSTARVKIEGLALKELKNNTYEIIAVTDNDESASELLTIRIQ